MEPIVIGQRADSNPLLLTPELRRSTHTHIIGGSGKGKSKFLEWLIRQDIRAGHGLCLIDWHGTLYEDVLRYCAYLDIGLLNDFRRLILINPSEPDYVTGFNPFMNQGDDISVQVSRRINATIRPWGITDTNSMPTFESVMRALYTFSVEHRETLPNAVHLLDYEQAELREYALRVITDPEGKRQLRRLIETRTLRDWKELVLSTDNRLGRFLGSKTVRRFMGLPQGNLDLLTAMNEGAIILINLGSSGYLDRESARVFASLLLNEFFETAMQRASQAPHGEKPSTFSLYLDEFQEYITDDVAAMLDQVRKGGLHMVLAHQHLGHLADNPRLLKSIFTNARIRAVFGGLDYEDSSTLANEMFLSDLNTRQIKKAYYHTTHLYREESRAVTSHSTSKGSSVGTSKSVGRSSGAGEAASHSTGSSAGSSVSLPYTADPALMQTEGWFTEGQSSSTAFSTASSSFSSDSYAEGESSSDSFSESVGETIVPVWVPIPVQELGSEAEWSREEKVSKVAEMLKYQQERHCFIKLDTEITQPLKVPFVSDYFVSDENLVDYEKEVYEAQHAISGSDADRLIQENETRFLSSAREVIDAPAADPPLTKAVAPRAKRSRQAKKSVFNSIEADPIGRE